MRSVSVLVVDDTAPLVRSIQAFLTSAGHRVATAFSCAEARKRMAEAYPEVVLLDLNLPDGNGGELMGKRRRPTPTSSSSSSPPSAASARRWRPRAVAPPTT
ncbi:MAG: response regulator [Myxococcales bacterium]